MLHDLQQLLLLMDGRLELELQLPQRAQVLERAAPRVLAPGDREAGGRLVRPVRPHQVRLGVAALGVDAERVAILPEPPVAAAEGDGHLLDRLHDGQPADALEVALEPELLREEVHSSDERELVRPEAREVRCLVVVARAFWLAVVPEHVLSVDQRQVVGFEVYSAAGQQEIGEEGLVGRVAGACVVRILLIQDVLVLGEDVLENAISNFWRNAAVE